MKLSFISFAYALGWRSARGQEQNGTFLRGSGSDAEAVPEEYKRTRDRHLGSLFEEVSGDVTSSIVGGGHVDPQEYKVGSIFLIPLGRVRPKHFLHLYTSSRHRVVLCLVKWMWSLSRGTQCGTSI
jgi:hypothetical protein